MRATVLILGALITILSQASAYAQASKYRGQVSWMCASMVCYYNTRQPPPNKWGACWVIAPEGVPCYCFVQKATGTIGYPGTTAWQDRCH
jgi:hypothetical protein